MSYYVHCGHVPSRRDDLISLFYILWEVVFGSFVDKSKQLFSKTYSLDSIYHPYNEYVKHLKKWETLEENMNQYTHELKIFMNSILGFILQKIGMELNRYSLYHLSKTSCIDFI